MRVYFVRHGQSESNAANRRQGATTPLSEAGKQQAQLVAERFARIPIDVIISSDYSRAVETAQVIAKTIHKEVIFTHLAQEKRSPSVVHGLPADDPGVLEIERITSENFADKNFHHSDEENFYDLQARATQLIEFIVSQKQENVLVVTHGGLLRCLTGLLMFAEDFSPEIFRKFKFLYLENTGITVCELSDVGWRLLTWNDLAHLGESA